MTDTIERTFDEVLEECAKLEGWYIKENGMIRIDRDDVYCCPLTCGIFGCEPTRTVMLMDCRYRMSTGERYRIADAADGVCGAGEDTAARTERMKIDRVKMIAALGLEGA